MRDILYFEALFLNNWTGDFYDYIDNFYNDNTYFFYNDNT